MFDQFYTNKKIAIHCFDQLSKIIDINKFDLILEPSAGEGSFYDLLPVTKRVGIDIDPKHPEIKKQDFLTYYPNFCSYLTIGNPPFGKNSKLAIDFFNKAAQFSKTIAFIVPRTFRKLSVHKRLNLNFHLIHDEVLPTNSFIYEGKEYDVPCLFQIWTKKMTERVIDDSPTTHSDFVFTSHVNCDYAIQRVGENAGTIKDKCNKVSPQSHYFIKENVTGTRTILEQIDWEDVKRNTAGNPSISKRELIKLYTHIKASLGN